jgi:hypothetical protein
VYRYRQRANAFTHARLRHLRWHLYDRYSTLKRGQGWRLRRDPKAPFVKSPHVFFMGGVTEHQPLATDHNVDPVDGGNVPPGAA